jgi:hypothetical protein
VAKKILDLVLVELSKRAAKGDLSAKQLKEVKPLLEKGINEPNLIALGYLSPLNAGDPAQVKRAATAYRKSLEASPAARRREQIASGRDAGLMDFFDEDLAPIVTTKPEDLYGSVLIPNVGDTTATGRTVTRYGGFEPEIPIESHGGPDFPRQMQARELPFGWASNRDAAAKKQAQFDKVAEETGLNPIAVTTAMGYDANFFAAPYADAFIQKARGLKIPAKDAKVFDEMVRKGVGNMNSRTGKMQYSIKPFPEWVGINHPEARDQLLGLGDYPNIGGRRVTVMTAAANQKKFRDMGFPIIEDIHRAMQMQGAEALERGDAGFTLYRPEVGAEVEPIGFHQSYDTGIRGEYFGQIEGVSVPPEIMFPDIMADYAARGKSRADAIGGFMMNTDLRQVADQKWLDNISKYLESNPEQRKAMLAALTGAGIITASSQSQAGPLTYAKGGKQIAQRMLDTELNNISSAGTKAARSIGDEVKRLVDMGYPESVAQRIASGELPMDYASRMQRAEDLGYDVNNVEYRGGGLTQIESPNRLFDNGFYTSQNPYLANTYSMKQGGNVMPVLINKDNYMQVEGGGRFWDQIQAGDSPDLQDAFDALGYNASHGLRGEITTDEVLDIADDAGRRGVSFNQVKDMGPYSRKLGKEMIYKGGEPSNNTASLNQRNVRSALSAAFDPEYVGPNILGNADPRLLAGLAGGSLLGAAVMPKDAEASVSGVVNQALDINYPRQVTVGEAKTPEANYNLLDAVVPAVAAAYDYGDGANFPVRPAQEAPEPKAQKSDVKPTPSVVPMGVPINPYTFLMSTGADQGEAARYVTDAYTNIARGAGNAMAGFGGEMETLGKGLMYALTGQGLGGSPLSRFMQVLNKYDPQLPNTQDVSQVPALLPNVSPMTEEERRMYQLAGEFLSPL